MTENTSPASAATDLIEPMLRKCTRCKVEKDASNYHKDRRKSGGLACHCKQCDAARKQSYRDANRGLVREQGRDQYQRSREKRRASRKKWMAANPDKMKEAKRRHRQSPKARVEANVRGHIHKAIKRGYKFERTFEALGYTVVQLMRHLESLFQPGMTWKNYGEWHIDHKTPNSIFNYETTHDLDFKRAWALSNLQPLWAKDNMQKSAKHDAPFQPSLKLRVPANDNSNHFESHHRYNA